MGPASPEEKQMSMPDGIELRCSAIIVRQQAALLVHRTRGAADDWVLPGGTPRPGESMAACARREVLEETGLHVDPSRVGFVLEVLGPDGGPRTVDIVFVATEAVAGDSPQEREPGLRPAFIPADELNTLDLRPPLAGYIRSMLGRRRQLYAPYLANLWRPPRSGHAGAESDVTTARRAGGRR
jgi:8-oxo-dGTP diphosphatase